VVGMSGYLLPTSSKSPLLLGSFSLTTFTEIGGQLYFIAVNEAQKAIYVIFRGATSRGDWLTAAEYSPVACKPQVFPNAPPDCTVRYGFQESTNRILTDPSTGILAALPPVMQKYPQFDVVFAGHSLGAAIAAYTAHAVKLRFPNMRLRALFTFGQPILGNAIFTDWLTGNIVASRFLRGLSSDDIVPYMTLVADTKLPLKDQYRHTPNAPILYFSNPKVRKFRKCPDANDKKCNQYTCEQRNWESHSNYGAWRIAQRFCLLSSKPQKVEWV